MRPPPSPPPCIAGKFGAFIATIPNCVLGGMTTFLFANVIASGIKVKPCGASLGDLRAASAASAGCQHVSHAARWASTPPCTLPSHVPSLPGPQIIAGCHLNRRNRFIIACSMGLGIGVTAYPQ